MGRQYKILESPKRTCDSCHYELDLYIDFPKAGKYFLRICKSCAYERYEAWHRVKPEVNRIACRKYYRKKRQRGRYICFTCPSKLERSNPSGYCLQCYILMWIRCQWRNFEKHRLGDERTKERRDQLKTIAHELIGLPDGNKFPEYRLKHIRSVKNYPEDAFKIRNIQWVPVNHNLSSKHRREYAKSHN